MSAEFRFWSNPFGNGNDISLTPFYEFIYFLTPRIGAYARVSAVTLSLSGGIDLSTYINARIGLSFSMPGQDRVISSL